MRCTELKLHRRVKLLLGPPGTGKTTRLIDIVKSHLDSGLPPDGVFYISFTRKAALEARNRTTEKTNIPEEELEGFSTIHSLCYKIIGNTEHQVIRRSNLIEFARTQGVFISTKKQNEIVEERSSGTTDGDSMLFVHTQSISRQIGLLESFRKFGSPRIPFARQQLFSESYERYKKKAGVIDFDDMLNLAIASPRLFPRPSLLVVDEAQDLSRLQWQVVKILAQRSGKVVIAGDDDQAIYTWSGADIESFLNLEAEREILSRSWRLPQTVYTLSNQLSSRIKNRYKKQWEYNPERGIGNVSYITRLEQAPLSEGSWLILVRNRYLFEYVLPHLQHAAYSFSAPIDSPITPERLRAIRWWETVRLDGRRIPIEEAINVYEHMYVHKGFRRGNKSLGMFEKGHSISEEEWRRYGGLLADGPWYDVLTKIPMSDRQYIRRMLLAGESLSSPRIRVSTIHGAKGGEADNVLLLTDMSPKTFEAFHEFPDDEHRVWYVAVTRARKSVYVVSPFGRDGYTI